MPDGSARSDRQACSQLARTGNLIVWPVVGLRAAGRAFGKGLHRREGAAEAMTLKAVSPPAAFTQSM
jgi:hypothetical protein